MNLDPMKKAMNTSPSYNDTQRTLGWKIILETAKVAEKNGEFEGARILYQRALQMAEDRLGEDNLIVAHILMQFANFYELQKKHQEAQPLHARARAVLSKLAQFQPSGGLD